MQFFTQKKGIKITRRHEIGVQNVQMGQKYVKRGQHGPIWVNTDQKWGWNGPKRVKNVIQKSLKTIKKSPIMFITVYLTFVENVAGKQDGEK